MEHPCCRLVACNAVVSLQHEQGNRRLEAVCILCHAEITAVHGACGRAQAAAAGVLEGLSCFQQRLVAHHAQALDLFGVATRVVDDPVAGDQLRGHIAAVGDGDGVGEAVDILRRVRLLGQVLGLDINGELVLGHKCNGNPPGFAALSPTPCGGSTSGLAKPVPRCLLEGLRAFFAAGSSGWSRLTLRQYRV